MFSYTTCAGAASLKRHPRVRFIDPVLIVVPDVPAFRVFGHNIGERRAGAHRGMRELAK